MEGVPGRRGGEDVTRGCKREKDKRENRGWESTERESEPEKEKLTTISIVLSRFPHNCW